MNLIAIYVHDKLLLINRYLIAMSDIRQSRTGFCIKAVNKTERQIIRIFFWSQFICLVPFFITDWVTIFTNDYDYPSACLYTYIDDHSILNIQGWLWIDGFAKMLTFFFIFFITLLDTESMSRSYVTFNGNLIRLFYLFDFAWTVVGSVLFWGKHRGYYPYPPYTEQYQPTYTFCSAPFKGYIFFLLIFSYIIIPINLYISSLRPISQFRGQILMADQTTRRDTQLIEKPKIIEL